VLGPDVEDLLLGCRPAAVVLEYQAEAFQVLIERVFALIAPPRARPVARGVG
jgi:hypothetical protein